jgi:DNA-binding NtrC family response regulator
MAPPPEVDQGHPAQVHRQLSLAGEPAWWQLDFFPLGAGDRLLGILGKITPLERMVTAAAPPVSEKLLALRQRHLQRFRLEEVVGEAPATLRLRAQIRLAAQTRLPVLLVGAPGTGKHWAARAIHQQGPWRPQTFANLDCGRLPPQVLGTLLFATAPFAFIYLQNLTAMPLDLQERLRQRLETGEELPWKLCAGTPDLPAEALAKGQLLHELYCWLSTLVIHMPTLQERMEDFERWALHLLPRASRATDRQVRGLNPEAVEILRSHAWPGNLEELYQVLVGACLRAKREQLEPSDLPFYLRHAPLPTEKPLALDAILEEVERRLIVQALRLARNNKSRAAELLTIWRGRLVRRIESLNIPDP